jgi:ABC-type multidrug transport system ATPase subunit
VLIVSSELDEIYALADRIAVMYEGKITGFRDPEVPAAELGRLMAGGADTEPEPELEAAPGPATTSAAGSGPGPTTVSDPAFGAGPEPGPPPEATAPQEEI